MYKTHPKLEQFASGYECQHFDAKELLIDANENSAVVYWLAKGQVRQYTISEDGEELTVHVFDQGSLFPLMWAISHIPNRHYFETIGLVNVRIIPIDDYINFIRQDPELLFALTNRLLYGLNGLLIRIESLSLESAYKRVIAAMLYLSQHFGTLEEDRVTISIRLTHKDIATYTGLTRETTSVELSKLEKQGLLDHDGYNLVIPSLSNLKLQL